jgi:hypothetical protein
MYKIGDGNNGFSFVHDTDAQLLRVRLWGFWEETHLEAFVKALQGKLPQGTKGLLVDITLLKPQREPGQEAIRAVAALPKSLGCSYAAVVFDNILGKLQFARIAKDVSTILWRFYRSEEIAATEFAQAS